MKREKITFHCEFNSEHKWEGIFYPEAGDGIGILLGSWKCECGGNGEVEKVEEIDDSFVKVFKARKLGRSKFKIGEKVTHTLARQKMFGVIEDIELDPQLRVTYKVNWGEVRTEIGILVNSPHKLWQLEKDLEVI